LAIAQEIHTTKDNLNLLSSEFKHLQFELKKTENKEDFDQK